MCSKSLRCILFFLIAASLLSCSSYPAKSSTQISIDQTSLAVNAPTFVIGSIFTQPIDPSGKLFLSAWLDPDGSDFDQKIWDHFALQSNETITEINWFGGYDPLKNGMGGPVLDFTVAIYPSIAAGTEPAVAGPPLVEYQTGGSAGETSVGTVGGIPMYSYAFSLPTSFDASAGVKYWVHIVASQGGSSPDWGIAAGTGGNSSHYRWGAGAGGDSGFRSVPGDAAFTLLGPVPDTPTDIFLSNTIVDENQPVNTVVGVLTAADPDPNATFTFSLTCAVAGADDGSFNILGTNLQTSAIFDFETKSTYNICVRVMDQGGLTFDENFVITVNNLIENTAPTDISLSNMTVDENQPVNTVVGALTATDPDPGATFTFSLTCAVAGADDGSFNILGTDLRASAMFDFEVKSAYNICLRVMDQGGLTFDEDFVVTVNNVNEPPTDISLSVNSVNENQPINTVVGALTATDPDAGATFTLSLTCAVAGVDDGSFNILGTNLQTSAIFDFETKSTYNICVRVTDQGGLTFDKYFVITVNNVFENAAPIDIALSNTTVDENQPLNTVVGVLSATDPDAGATFTFSLTCAVAGVNDGSFNIFGTDLRTSAVFDFETKSIYDVCLRVTDQGGLTFDENFVITVNNVFENAAPMDIALSNTTVNENQPINTVVGALSATDPDAGATFTFSLTCAVAGADDGSFNILGTDLRTSAIFEFETKPIYNLCIRVTDQGGLTFDKNFVVTVNNVAEDTAPTDIALSNTTVNENQPVDTVVGTLTAADPDAGATFTFSLACAASGADNASFNILGTNLRTSVIFDFETKSTYNICIRVTDQAGLTFDKNFVITVNDVNENAAPTDISLSNTTVNENQPVNTVVGKLSATHPDAGATFTFSLTCATAGVDDGSFNILGKNLRTSATFDFEAKSIYNLCIRVTDQGGLTFEENFVITVKDLNEATNTPGKVTGAGNIGSEKGKDKITFRFLIAFKEGDSEPRGNLTYQDHGTGLRLKATSFDLLAIEGDHAWFTGTGTMQDGQVVTFTVEIDAPSEPGQPETFYIYIPELKGYEAGGALTGGNITIH